MKSAFLSMLRISLWNGSFFNHFKKMNVIPSQLYILDSLNLLRKKKLFGFGEMCLSRNYKTAGHFQRFKQQSVNFNRGVSLKRMAPAALVYD